MHKLNNLLFKKKIIFHYEEYCAFNGIMYYWPVFCCTTNVLYFSVVGVAYLTFIAGEIMYPSIYADTFKQSTNDQKLIDILYFFQVIGNYYAKIIIFYLYILYYNTI